MTVLARPRFYPPRWHLYTAPVSWRPSSEEELESGHLLTTAPAVCFHPDMKCDVLATKFLDLSKPQQEVDRKQEQEQQQQPSNHGMFQVT